MVEPMDVVANKCSTLLAPSFIFAFKNNFDKRSQTGSQKKQGNYTQGHKNGRGRRGYKSKPRKLPKDSKPNMFKTSIRNTVLMPPPMYQANPALPPIPLCVQFADNISSPFAIHTNFVMSQTGEFTMATRIYDGQD